MFVQRRPDERSFGIEIGCTLQPQFTLKESNRAVECKARESVTVRSKRLVIPGRTARFEVAERIAHSLEIGPRDEDVTVDAPRVQGRDALVALRWIGLSFDFQPQPGSAGRSICPKPRDVRE